MVRPNLVSVLCWVASGVRKHAETRPRRVWGHAPSGKLKFTVSEAASESSFNRHALASQDIQDSEI